MRASSAIVLPDSGRLKFLKKNFLETLKSKTYPLGFLRAPDENLIRRIKEFVREHKDIEDYCLIGIGGSAAPAKALHQFFSESNHPRFWVLDTIDSQAVDSTLKILGSRPRQALFHVVSKSGTTLEVELLRQEVMRQMKRFLPTDWFRHFAVTTTPNEENPLDQWARASGIPVFDLPSDVGGRFSSFTPVTFLWASFLGLEPQRIWKGAQAVLDDCEGALLYAERLWENTRAGKTVLGLFLYGGFLAGLAEFLSQLFAESLGKHRKGLTPLPFIGTRDQHSLLQLFLDGPRDKMATIVSRVEPTPGDVYSRALWASLEGVAQALVDRGVPVFKILLKEKSEFSYGALIQFFHIAVAALGELFKVNAFDQPMVELQKRYTRELLGKGQ